MINQPLFLANNNNITDITSVGQQLVLEQLLTSLLSVSNDWGDTSELTEPAATKSKVNGGGSGYFGITFLIHIMIIFIFFPFKVKVAIFQS